MAAKKKTGKGAKSNAKKQLKDLDAKGGKDVKGGAVTTTISIKRPR